MLPSRCDRHGDEGLDLPPTPTGDGFGVVVVVKRLAMKENNEEMSKKGRSNICTIGFFPHDVTAVVVFYLIIMKISRLFFSVFTLASCGVFTTNIAVGVSPSSSNVCVSISDVTSRRG